MRLVASGFLALREAAATRLFTHVPWLRSHLMATVEAYARGITIDVDQLEEAVSAIDPTDATALCTAPPPLARRAIRRWLTGEHPPEAAAVERVLAVARGEAKAGDVGGGRRVARTRGRLRLEG